MGSTSPVPIKLINIFLYFDIHEIYECLGDLKFVPAHVFAESKNRYRNAQ